MRGVLRGVAAALLATVVVFACGRREPPTMERLQAAIAAYAAGEAEPGEAQIDALFAQLDADVAALRAEAAAKPGTNAGERADELARQRFVLWQTYVKAKMERLRGLAESTVRDVGKQVGQGLEEAGRRIQESMQK